MKLAASIPTSVHGARYRFACAICIGAITLSGCGDSLGGGSVNGTVAYQNQPLGSAAIYFFPEDGGRPVVGRTDEQGQYSMDVPPGNYRVTVELIETAPPGWKEGDPLPPAKESLPAQYTTQAKTVLTATIAENQDEPINFDLK